MDECRINYLIKQQLKSLKIITNRDDDFLDIGILLDGEIIGNSTVYIGGPID